MFCRNCGRQAPQDTAYCSGCGVPLGVGYVHCPSCGGPTQLTTTICSQCGAPVTPATSQGAGTPPSPPGASNSYTPPLPGTATPPPSPYPETGRGYSQSYPPPPNSELKSRLIAGLLGIFLGGLGIHNFYLGNTQKGVIQIIVSLAGGLFTCGLAAIGISIWALVEAIMILSGSINTDGYGRSLKE